MLAAVIIETRNLPNLTEVIENHLKYLPKGTHLYFFGSVLNEGVANKFNCTFYTMPQNLTERAYNVLFTDSKLWSLIDEENILIFQHDSRLLTHGIEEFYQYDYVGAPWKFSEHGGNGGLSFRKKSAMLNVIKNSPPYSQANDGNEDIWFCNNLKRLNLNLAPRNICQLFSVESIFALGSLGFHAIEKHLTHSEITRIKKQYL